MLSVHEAGQVFVTPSAYADEKYFYEACAVLRKSSPVHYVENDKFILEGLAAEGRSADEVAQFLVGNE